MTQLSCSFTRQREDRTRDVLVGRFPDPIFEFEIRDHI